MLRLGPHGIPVWYTPSLRPRYYLIPPDRQQRFHWLIASQTAACAFWYRALSLALSPDVNAWLDRKSGGWTPPFTLLVADVALLFGIVTLHEAIARQFLAPLQAMQGEVRDSYDYRAIKVWYFMVAGLGWFGFWHMHDALLRAWLQPLSVTP